MLYYRFDFPWNKLEAYVEKIRLQRNGVQFEWMVKATVNGRTYFMKRAFIEANNMHDVKSLVLDQPYTTVELHLALPNRFAPIRFDFDHDDWYVHTFDNSVKYQLSLINYAIDYLNAKMPNTESMLFYSGRRGFHIDYFGLYTEDQVRQLYSQFKDISQSEVEYFWRYIILPTRTFEWIKGFVHDYDPGRYIKKWLDAYGDDYQGDNYDAFIFLEEAIKQEQVFSDLVEYQRRTEGLNDLTWTLYEWAIPNFDWDVTLNRRHMCRAPYSYHQKGNSFKVPFRSKERFLEWLECKNDDIFSYPVVSVYDIRHFF